jgi:hypothetical protein
MSVDHADDPSAPPPILEVRFRPRSQAIKLVLILLIPALVVFAMVKSDMSQVDAATWRFLAVIVLLSLVWATASWRATGTPAPCRGKTSR